MALRVMVEPSQEMGSFRSRRRQSAHTMVPPQRVHQRATQPRSQRPIRTPAASIANKSTTASGHGTTVHPHQVLWMGTARWCEHVGCPRHPRIGLRAQQTAWHKEAQPLRHPHSRGPCSSTLMLAEEKSQFIARHFSSSIIAAQESLGPGEVVRDLQYEVPRLPTVDGRTGELFEHADVELDLLRLGEAELRGESLH